MVHTLQFSTFSLPRKPVKSACWGGPQSPGKGRLRCLAKRSTGGPATRPCGRCKTGDLTGWRKGVCPSYLEAPAGGAATPQGTMERPPLAVLFQGLRSGPQQAFCRSVYTPALLATIVLRGIGIPAAHENSPGMRQGQSHAEAVMRNDRSPFPWVRDKHTGPQGLVSARPIRSRGGRPHLSAPTPLPAPPGNSPRLLRFRGRCAILRLSAGQRRGLLFLFYAAQMPPNFTSARCKA